MNTTRTAARPRAPAFIWVPAAAIGLAMLLPPVYLAVRAADAGSGIVDILLNTRTLAILARTLVLVTIVTATCTALGVALAWLTVRTDMPLRRTFAVLTALPLVIPSYLFARLLVITLGPRGTLQGWLEPLGVDRLPEVFGLPGAALTLSLLSFPYVLLPVRAALLRSDPSLEEASRGLGRGGWTTFMGVTLPMLRPAIAAGALLVALYTMSDFGAVSLLRYQTFTWAIYIQYESLIDRTVAAALSLALVSLALTLLFLETRTRGRAEYFRSSPGAARAISVVRLGRWRWAAAGFAGSVVGASLAAPIAVLLFWVVRGLGAGESLSLLWSNTANTLYVAVLAAMVAAAAGIPVAVLAVRYPSRASAAIERLAYVGFALPGVAVALAFVFFALALARPVYQTTLLLVVAYVMLFLPAAVGATQAALRQVSPRLEEAARGLGKTPGQAFRLVTLPLLGRGVLAGAALVLLLTMKELPATLILAPPGFTTLATSIWSAETEAFFARTAMGALLLVLAAVPPVVFLVARERR